MGADRFEDVSQVVAGSLPARALRHVAAGARAAAPRSVAGIAFARARAGLAAIPLLERIPLSGILLLSAAVTHDTLLRVVPEVARPAAPRALRAAAALIGLAVIPMAPALERAWRTSRVRGKLLPQLLR